MPIPRPLRSVGRFSLTASVRQSESSPPSSVTYFVDYTSNSKYSCRIDKYAISPRPYDVDFVNGATPVDAYRVAQHRGQNYLLSTSIDRSVLSSRANRPDRSPASVATAPCGEERSSRSTREAAPQASSRPVQRPARFANGADRMGAYVGSSRRRRRAHRPTYHGRDSCRSGTTDLSRSRRRTRRSTASHRQVYSQLSV